MPTDMARRARVLLDRDGLGQVARLVDVQPALARDVVGEQLQRDDREQRLQHPVRARDVDDLLGDRLRARRRPRWRSR